MSKKHTLHEQVVHVYAGKMAIGQSRHAAKEAIREAKTVAGETYNPTKDTPDLIYSIGTRQTYTAAADRFVDWCHNEQGVPLRASLASCERYTRDYLAARDADPDISAYTVRTERAALGKLYGHAIDYTIQSNNEVTRSRGEAVRDAHFAEDKNADLVTLARATGGRRDDLARLTPADVYKGSDGNMYAHFAQSKGGRDREAVILPQYADTVREIVQRAADVRGDDKPIFDHIHSAADIHAYRRDYAQALYNAVTHDADLKQSLYDKYHIDSPASPDYHMRDGSGRVYDREALAPVSQALGHSRVDTSIAHYLT